MKLSLSSPYRNLYTCMHNSSVTKCPHLPQLSIFHCPPPQHPVRMWEELGHQCHQRRLPAWVSRGHWWDDTPPQVRGATVVLAEILLPRHTHGRGYSLCFLLQIKVSKKTGLLFYIQKHQVDPEIGYGKHASRCLLQICKNWCVQISGLFLAFVG